MGVKKLQRKTKFKFDMFPESFVNALKGTVVDRDLYENQPLPAPGSYSPLNAYLPMAICLFANALINERLQQWDSLSAARFHADLEDVREGFRFGDAWEPVKAALLAHVFERHYDPAGNAFCLLRPSVFQASKHYAKGGRSLITIAHDDLL